MNLGVYQCYSSENQLTRHALPALILGELWVFEQQLESRPYRGSCCFSAVDGIRAKREASSNGLVNVDHCDTSHTCEKMITIHGGNSVLLLTLFQLKKTVRYNLMVYKLDGGCPPEWIQNSRLAIWIDVARAIL